MAFVHSRVYLLSPGREKRKKKRWQICVIEICFSKPKGTALFNDSMGGIIVLAHSQGINFNTGLSPHSTNSMPPAPTVR